MLHDFLNPSYSLFLVIQNYLFQFVSLHLVIHSCFIVCDSFLHFQGLQSTFNHEFSKTKVFCIYLCGQSHYFSLLQKFLGLPWWVRVKDVGKNFGLGGGPEICVSSPLLSSPPSIGLMKIWGNIWKTLPLTGERKTCFMAIDEIARIF